MDKIRIYFSGPFYSLVEREWNKNFIDRMKAIDARYDFILPQDLESQFPEEVLSNFYKEIESCQIMIVGLDGILEDSLSCFQIGYAKKLGKPIVGYRTDFRGSDDPELHSITRTQIDTYVFLNSQSAHIGMLVDRVSHSILFHLGYNEYPIHPSFLNIEDLEDRLRESAIINERAREEISLPNDFIADVIDGKSVVCSHSSPEQVCLPIHGYFESPAHEHAMAQKIAEKLKQ